MPNYNARQQQARRPRAGNCGSTYGDTSPPMSTSAVSFKRESVLVPFGLVLHVQHSAGAGLFGG